MTLDNIKKLPVYQTRSIATAAEDPDNQEANHTTILYCNEY